MVGGVGPSARAVTSAEVEPHHTAQALSQLVLWEWGYSVGVCYFSRRPRMGKNAVAGGWIAVGGATPQCVPLSTGGLLFFGSLSPSDPLLEIMSSLEPPINDTCLDIGQGHSFMIHPPRRVPCLGSVLMCESGALFFLLSLMFDWKV